MKLRHLSAVLAVAAMTLPQLAFAPSPASVAETTPWVSTAPIHPIAGRVTIEAPAGLSGIRLDTSGQVVRPMGEDLVIDSYDGAAAFILGVEESGPGFFDPREMSVIDWEIVSADFYRETDGTASGNGKPYTSTDCHTSDDPEVYGVPCWTDSPYLDYYIATDEPITFTLAFAGDDFEPLPGHLAFTPDGVIDGELVNMVGTCPTSDCSQTHFGGVTRDDIGHEQAFGTVITWTYARKSLHELQGVPTRATTRTTVAACTYPSVLYANSPRMEDHPLGCTVGAGVAGDSLEPQLDVTNGRRVVEDLDTALAVGRGTIWPGVHGEQYVGFHLRNWQMVDAFGEGTTGRWAFWLNPGIH